LHPVVAMELSRVTSIKRMVEEGMGVGIVPVRSALEEVAARRLIRWWIEGARINSELGFAFLSGGYQSPVMQTFINLCRAQFAAATEAANSRRLESHPASRKTKARRKKN